MSAKRVLTLSLLFLMLAGLVIACTPQTVEVTRVITETVTEEVEVPVEVEIPVEVTRVITETVIETVVETVIEEVMAERAPLGSEERPIKVLFVPSVEADIIVTGGEVLADALEQATGLNFEVIVPTSYAATVEEMCASPEDTIGFIPAQGYVLANERCGVTVGGAAVRQGLPWYTAMFVVRADSDIETLEDLEGRTWAIPSYTSTSGYLYPLAMLREAGIEPGEITEVPGHPAAMLAVYSEDVDFGTAFFSPPLMAGRTWTYGVDDPEIWRDAGELTFNDSGHSLIAGGPAEGGFRILDARASAVSTAPDIFDQTRILALTPQIPNDTVSFGPQFPLSLSQEIVDALVAFTRSEACAQSICAQDFYSWTGIDPVRDSFYDPVRAAMEALGITEEDVLGPG
ncbi:MAG: PhnD/SsuA/transferrin family substrate-binding protein [Anaerolineae bacterium]|nr:PhnD/SsuA/transferrin family substrate-binding protein [Anaerolineae bacterium]